MLTAYRIAYCLVLIMFLGNLPALYQPAIESQAVFALVAATTASLCALLILTLAFFRVRLGLLWVAALAWEALFAWYAWLSPAAPFAIHEVHGLTSSAIASAIMGHRIRAGAIFVALCGWFLSLPIVKLRCRQRGASHI